MSAYTVFEHLAAMHLDALREVISHSPIIVAASPKPAAQGIVDWANVRKSADVDTVVLTWIAGHARIRMVRGTIH